MSTKHACHILLVPRHFNQLIFCDRFCGFWPRPHDQNFVPLIICNKINVPSCEINVLPCQIIDPSSQINVLHCQINVPCQIKSSSFWDRIMTLGTFICKRVTYLCPFLTLCSGPKSSTCTKTLRAARLSRLTSRANLMKRCWLFCIRTARTIWASLSNGNSKKISRAHWLFW